MTSIFEYRALIWNFIKRDISQKYVGSLLGLPKSKGKINLIKWGIYDKECSLRKDLDWEPITCG